jgi:hypothetical protein
MRSDDEPIELSSPEITALLDVRTWAIATLLQIERIRAAWSDLHSLERRERQEIQGHEDPESAGIWEHIQIDVHFLINAANHLIEARRQQLQTDLPRLSRSVERAIEHLRTIREHYLEHRDVHYGHPPKTNRAAAKAAALKALDEAAHPWTVGGSFYNGELREMTIAGVLELDAFADEVQAIHDAADDALSAIVKEARAAGQR